MFSEKNMRIHPALIKEIKKIVKSGVTSTTEIKIHLKQFVDNMFGEDSAPNLTNKAFYPCKSIIYTHVYRIIYNEETVCGTEILNENEEQQSMAPEEIVSDSAIPINNLERKQQDLRESAKKIIEMSYLCTVETGIKTAIEACNSACSTLAKCIPSSSGLSSDSQKTGKTHWITNTNKM
ncbi:hypothetical protein R5R35_004671 [Gryllus longicercus]|uniref:Uncharacterized protein n=1 Tax=Gryllus longicercus TaxID=2509291 RepID=A0AAN9WVE1_9ORTH